MKKWLLCCIISFLELPVAKGQTANFTCTISISVPHESGYLAENYIKNITSSPKCLTESKFKGDKSIGDESVDIIDCPPGSETIRLGIRTTGVVESLNDHETCQTCETSTFDVNYTSSQSLSTKVADYESEFSSCLSNYNGTAQTDCPEDSALEIHDAIKHIKSTVAATMSVDYGLVTFNRVSCKSEIAVPALNYCLNECTSEGCTQYKPDFLDTMSGFTNKEDGFQPNDITYLLKLYKLSINDKLGSESIWKPEDATTYPNKMTDSQALKCADINHDGKLDLQETADLIGFYLSGTGYLAYNPGLYNYQTGTRLNYDDAVFDKTYSDDGFYLASYKPKSS